MSQHDTGVRRVCHVVRQPRVLHRTGEINNRKLLVGRASTSRGLFSSPGVAKARKSQHVRGASSGSPIATSVVPTLGSDHCTASSIPTRKPLLRIVFTAGLHAYVFRMNSQPHVTVEQHLRKPSALIPRLGWEHEHS